MYRYRIHAGRVPAALAADWQPPVDVVTETGRYLLRADLPGVDPAGVEITVEDGVLTVAGERPAHAATEGGRRTRSERACGRFSRVFELPEDADAEAVTASSHLGVLEIAVPRRDTRRRIEVEAA